MAQVNQYVLGDVLGKGGYATVVSATDVDSSRTVAVKILSTSLLKRQKEFSRVGRKMVVHTAFDDVLREIAIMKKLRHENVVQFVEVVDDADADKLYLVLELVRGGELMGWDDSVRLYKASPAVVAAVGGTSDKFDVDTAKTLLRDVVVGLTYLHAQGIVHRDLKPENLLYSTNDRKVKIADFGVSHALETATDETAEIDSTMKRVQGTHAFLAPECVAGGEFDGYASDVWALGVCAYAFLSGRIPFFETNSPDLFDAIATEDVPPLEDVSNVEAVKFVMQLLEKDPSKRPGTMKDVGSLEFLGFDAPFASVDRIEVTASEVEESISTVKLDFRAISNLKVSVSKWKKKSGLE